MAAEGVEAKTKDAVRLLRDLSVASWLPAPQPDRERAVVHSIVALYQESQALQRCVAAAPACERRQMTGLARAGCRDSRATTPRTGARRSCAF